MTETPQADQPTTLDDTTVSVVYVGLHCEVFMPELDDLVAVRGTPVKVTAEIADRLLEQTGNWVKAGTKAAKDAPPPVDAPQRDQQAEAAATA